MKGVGNSVREEPRRILVVAVPCLGDTFLALPLIRSLKKKFPAAKIDMLVLKGTHHMIQSATDINAVISYDYRSTVVSYLKMISSIFRRYDLAVSTSHSDRSILSCFYAAPWRISVVPPKRGADWWKRLMLHGFVENDLNIHTVIQNLKLADLLQVERSYDFPISIPEKSPLKSSKYFVLHCYSQGVHKNFYTTFWHTIIKKLLNFYPQDIILTCGPAEREIEEIGRIASPFGKRVINCGGKFSFEEIFRLVDDADAFIGVDTSVTHVSAVVGTPTVALFGPTSAAKWSPWPSQFVGNTSPFDNNPGMSRNGNVVVIKGTCECPNFPTRCRVRTDNRPAVASCIQAITATDVLRSLEMLLPTGNRSLPSNCQS